MGHRLLGVSLAIYLVAALGTASSGGETPTEPASSAVVASLPFVTSDPTRVMIDLAPEGQRSFTLMLDTGASGSWLTPGVAKELGVPVRRRKATAYRKSTRLGRDLQFHIDVETSDTASKTGFEYGLVGGDFLDDYVVEIDYPGRRVRFLDPRKYAVPETVVAADERVVPLRRVGTRLFVDLSVEGRPLEVVLDTGAPDPAVLSGAAAEALGIDVASLSPYGEMLTVMGPMKVLMMEAQAVGFGGFDLGPSPILVAPKGWYNQVGPNGSVVGYDVLRQFVLRIDYERKRLWLKRTGDPRPTLHGSDWELSRDIGAFLLPVDGGAWVRSVRDGSLAARYDMRAGDGIELRGLRDLAWLVSRMHEGKRVTVLRQTPDDPYGVDEAEFDLLPAPVSAPGPEAGADEAAGGEANGAP